MAAMAALLILAAAATPVDCPAQADGRYIKSIGPSLLRGDPQLILHAQRVCAQRLPICAPDAVTEYAKREFIRACFAQEGVT